MSNNLFWLVLYDFHDIRKVHARRCYGIINDVVNNHYTTSAVNLKLCKVKELSPEQECTHILVFREMALTNKQIDIRMGKSQRRVTKWRNKWDSFDNVGKLKRSGRPTKIRGRVKNRMEKMKCKGDNSRKKITKDLKQMEESVCYSTVHNYLKKTQKQWKPFKRQFTQFLTQFRRGNNWHLQKNTNTLSLMTGNIIFSQIRVLNICFTSPIRKMI